jgi:hypothetical protein
MESAPEKAKSFEPMEEERILQGWFQNLKFGSTSLKSSEARLATLHLDLILQQLQLNL